MRIFLTCTVTEIATQTFYEKNTSDSKFSNIFSSLAVLTVLLKPL